MAEMKKKSSLSAIFGEFVTQYPSHFGFLFLLLVVEGITAAMSILAVVPIADFMLNPGLEKSSRITQVVVNNLKAIGISPTFWVLGSLFIATNLLKGLLEVTIRYAILRIKYTIVRGLIGDALNAFFKARWGFFSSASQGRLLNTLTNEISTIGDTLGQIATLLAQLIQIGIYLLIPIWLNAQMTITAIILVFVFAIPFMLLNNFSYHLGKQNTETSNVAMGVLSELIGAARLVMGFGRQKQARETFLNAFDQHVQVTLRSQVLVTAVPKLFNPMAMLAVVGAIGVAVHQQTPISELAAVMWSLLATMPLFSALLQGNISISNFLPSYEQLVSLRKSAAGLEEIQGMRIFSRLEYGIEFKDLSFTYPGRAKTLTNINLHLRKGLMTALVGESGSGKSTVTDLVLGLQIPEKGQVLIDGFPFGDWKQNSFRERVGYVPQDPLLFHATIRENLLWSLDEATEGQMWRALELANAATFVKEMPQGINTAVGDRGIRLSGGQRQRIALARALLREPELLILDEATSALDSESELLIQQSIERVALETTMLVVAHRLSTIAKADYVYVIKEGRIAEEGTFLSLSGKSGGILHNMLALQLSRT